MLFDDALSGWGPEDKELAIRLFHRHGYHFTCPEIPEVYHLGRRTGVKPEKFGEWLRNKFYVKDKYPDLDLTNQFSALRYWHLQPDGTRWRRGEARSEPLPELIRQAERWLGTRTIRAA